MCAAGADVAVGGCRDDVDAPPWACARPGSCDSPDEEGADGTAYASECEDV